MWRQYHEATKHSVESLTRLRRVLDWANMPDPFRHYEGVPVLDLRADPPAAYLDPDLEAFSLIAMSAGLATSVLAGQSSPGQAQAVIDYHLDRLFPAAG